MTRSYLLYKGPGDLYVEMGLCATVPAKGDVVTVDGKRYVVSRVEWDVYTRGNDAFPVPIDYYPQQCATVHLARKRA